MAIFFNTEDTESTERIRAEYLEELERERMLRRSANRQWRRELQSRGRGTADLVKLD